ncbi:MAG: TlpA family protein disulfide reductase [Dysgonamonadaceae bacterium]|jgi:thiol-disulfide isomerase/thioredoxin|nr:TlpA family protein disulfide reductase [Dysgonamonadaceae bacterium]
MKHLSLICIIALTSFGASFAKGKVIVNPVYEFTSSGITHIVKIETGEKETRLHIREIFIPHWWVRFPKTAYIEDCATGKRYQATGIINGEFDKEIYMPDSGDSTFVLIFPPLDKSVTKINFCDTDEDDNLTIFGISLDAKAKPLAKEPPAKVLQWLDGELSKAKRQTMPDFEADEFFMPDTARLIGYIKGYDPRAGFSTGMIYTGNEITREDFPIAVKIHEDGRFECDIPLNYPVYSGIIFNRNVVDFYICPGQTLAMLLDWEDFRMADRLRNTMYTFKNVKYKGVAANINNELSAFYAQLPEFPFRKIYDEMGNKKTDEFKAFYDELISDYTRAYQRLLETEKLSDPTKNLLRNNYQMTYAMYLFEYEMNYSRKDSNKTPLEFYNFLQDIPMNNKELLSAKNFSGFINRLEYCQPLNVKYIYAKTTTTTFAIPYHQYLFDELNIRKTKEDEAYIQKFDSLVKIGKQTLTQEETEKWEKEYNNNLDRFVARHGENNYKDYKNKYAEIVVAESYPRTEILLRNWQAKDSVYTNVLKLKPGILYDLTKIRSLDHIFGDLLNDDKEGAWEILTALTADIPESFLKKEGDRLFQKNFPEEQKAAYKLPDTYEAGIFKELIAPFKGKIVLVDFWSTSCGPCISIIKYTQNLREKYKDSPDVAFVFITSEDESPKTRYDQFVAEQELTHTYRLNADQYRYLRQLFRFNGIPRHVLVDRKGDILNDNLRGSFEEEIKKLILE